MSKYSLQTDRQADQHLVMLRLIKRGYIVASLLKRSGKKWDTDIHSKQFFVSILTNKVVPILGLKLIILLELKWMS